MTTTASPATGGPAAQAGVEGEVDGAGGTRPSPSYRWVVLAVTMGVNLVMQVLWISYAAVTDQAARFYGVSHLEVGLLAMAFMLLFIPLALPASWIIDARGFRVAVGAGSVLMALGALGRGLAGHSYTGALVATLVIAAAQPLLINAWTTMPARWMAPGERATAVGLITLANLVGIALGEALTPLLVKEMSLSSVQLCYGGLAVVATTFFLLLARERPATSPAGPDEEVRSLMLDGLRHILRARAFVVYLAVWFAGMGIFNGVLTWIDDILRPRGFSSADAGVAGALVLVGGIMGSVALAPLSDRRGRRVGYMLAGLVLAVPGLVGFTLASTPWLLDVSAFAFGFFLISVGPIGMQYVAEVTRPTPEATSQGVLQLVGQGSVALVYLMTLLKTSSGSYTPALLLTVGLLVAGAALVSRLREPAPVTVPAVVDDGSGP